MIYFFYSENLDEVNKKANKLFKSLQEKKPEASFIIFDEENSDNFNIDELISLNGLFEKKIVVLFKSVFSNEEKFNEIKKRINDLKQTESIFIFVSGKAKAEGVNFLEKNADKAFVSKEKKTKITDAKYDSFAISDVFASKDKKKFWKLLVLGRGLLQKDSSAESVHGILWWQLKVLKVVSLTKDAKEAGLNPFVFSKAKKSLANFKKGEIDILLKRFVKIYHDAHLGKCDIFDELEKIALEL